MNTIAIIDGKIVITGPPGEGQANAIKSLLGTLGIKFREDPDYEGDTEYQCSTTFVLDAGPEIVVRKTFSSKEIA